MPLNKNTTYDAPPPSPCFESSFTATYKPQNDQRDEAVILSHTCCPPPPPPPHIAASPQTPPTGDLALI